MKSNTWCPLLTAVMILSGLPVEEKEMMIPLRLLS